MMNIKKLRCSYFPDNLRFYNGISVNSELTFNLKNIFPIIKII